MGRKVVGITSGTAGSEYGARHVLNRAYVQAVEAAGGIAVILPVASTAEARSRYLGIIDGLLLSGGVDIHPSHFGEEEHPKLGEVDADRDATEIPLTCEALAQDMPVFGICRGLQTLNVALGGTLYQDLPAQLPTNIHHQQMDNKIPRPQPIHTVTINRNSRLYSVIGADTIETNSLHHQALKDVAEGLVITAYAPDGIIEAAEMPGKRYVIAVQFHPEETAPHDERARRLFEGFVAEL